MQVDMEVMSRLEAALFLATSPMTPSALARCVGASLPQVQEALALLAQRRNTPESGIHLLCNGATWQLATNPACADIAEALQQGEETGELTRPGMETLAVVAYRGPVTRAQIEAIRGVACGLIVRNLSLRGLLEEQGTSPTGEPRYILSMDAVRFLGVDDVTQLPDYATLHGDAAVAQLLAALAPADAV